MGNYAAATRATSPQLEPTSFFPQQPLAKICEGGPFWARGTANLTSPANPIATLHQGSSTLPCAFKVLFNSARLLALRCAVGLAAGRRLPNSARPRTTPLFNGYLQLSSSAIADDASMAIART
jgi:hypothetical protein